MILSLFFFIAALVFLFVLYMLGKEDFVLIRKNVNLEQLFNIAFLSLFFGVFFARLSYVLLHPSRLYLNPLVFPLFTYYPGLSLFGGVVGAVLFLFLYGHLKRIPKGRLLDFFSLAFLACLPFAYIGYFLITKDRTIYWLVVTPLAYLIVFFIYMKILLSQLSKGKLSEGSLGGIFLMTFSLISLIGNLTVKSNHLLIELLVENILFIILFLSTCFFVIRQEMVVSGKVRKS